MTRSFTRPKPLSLVGWGLGLGTVLALGHPAASAVSASPQACQALTGLSTGSLKVESAAWTPVGSSPDAGPGRPAGPPLPEHCLARGVIDPRQDAAGRVFGVRFELRLPSRWNGRFFFQGGGGMDGSVRPAMGAVSGGPPALTRGYAVVSMDGGHEGPDADFASDQQARLDFAYQAVGKTAEAAKRLIGAYYGTPPIHSYFVGCSNGGREAMIAAERYPTAFDGVIAGSPGFRLSHAAVQEAWANSILAAIAPKDALGNPQIQLALTDADLELVADKVLADCDALDGLKDGLISNPEACRFSVRAIACPTEGASQCLSAPKAAALDRIFAGAHDGAGRPLYSRFYWDSGIAQPNWRSWVLGVKGRPALNVALGADSLSRYFLVPAQPGRSPYSLDFDRAAEGVAQTGALNDAISTELGGFAQHGGKLILYHGVSDPVFSAADTAGWYRSLLAGDPAAARYARLFLVPGMNHCTGGQATDTFDMLAALETWVEAGQAPEQVLATGASMPGLSRPLCAYPTYARFKGGDPKDAASFSCAAPET